MKNPYTRTLHVEHGDLSYKVDDVPIQLVRAMVAELRELHGPRVKVRIR